MLATVWVTVSVQLSVLEMALMSATVWVTASDLPMAQVSVLEMALMSATVWLTACCTRTVQLRSLDSLEHMRYMSRPRG